MTNTQKKARDIVRNEDAHGYLNYDSAFAALCRTIEQHEAFKQDVSDAVTALLDRFLGDGLSQGVINGHLHQFIVRKPDPLVEVLKDFGGFMPDADDFRAALEARGLEIRSKANDQ